MLQHAARFVDEEDPGTDAYFAHLEAFCVHARNLIHFLHPNTAKDDDVLAQDFFDDLILWKKKRGALPELLKKARERVNVEVAHLSYERLGRLGEEKKWPFQDICAAIEGRLGVFRSLLSKSRLAERLVESPPTAPSLAAEAFGVIPNNTDSGLIVRSMAGMTSSIAILTVRPLPGEWSEED
jgi:hypothetical protein